MFGSLRERLARRQHLQRRIDALVQGLASPGIKDMDAHPLVEDDIEAAIAEVFRLGRNEPNFARPRRDR
jgi:hypothetical protein